MEAKMFSERLNLILKEKNISQTELSDKIGFTRQAISNWCTGKTEPENNVLVKIADYLEVSTDFLLGRNEKKNTKLENELREKEALINALINAGYMNDGEDITDKELENLMEMAKANKKFIKGLKQSEKVNIICNHFIIM